MYTCFLQDRYICTLFKKYICIYSILSIIIIGTPLDGELICEMAKYFYTLHYGKDDFHASQGWLQILQNPLPAVDIGEKLSTGTIAVKPFKLIKSSRNDK